MTLTHEAMLKDATVKAALEIPLVVIGSVDKYKPRVPCELRIDTPGNPGKCLAKKDLRLNKPEYDFLVNLCRMFNDNERNRVLLSIFPH